MSELDKKPAENGQNEPQFVDENVVGKTRKKSRKKKDTKYIKGKYPYTVFNTENKNLFVRKTYIIAEPKLNKETGEITYVKKSKQIWRKCDPQTSERAAEILSDIKEEILFLLTGRTRPLSVFREVATDFEKVELIPPIYGKDGQKIAGMISASNQKYLLKTLTDYFGTKNLKDITFGDLEVFKLHRLKTPVERSGQYFPRTLSAVNHELSLLRKIFNHAVRRRWLNRSPFADGKGLIDAASENRRHVKLSRAEEKAALTYCKGTKLEHMKVFIICILDGGFRRGELLNAKWSEINWHENYIPAKSHKGKKMRIRPVYMTKRIRETLLDWQVRQKKNKKISHKSLIIGYRDVDTAWGSIRKKINREDVTIHDLRHVFATRAYFDAKISLYEVSLMLGHSNIKTTQIYINARDEHLKDAVLKLDDLNDFNDTEKNQPEN